MKSVKTLLVFVLSFGLLNAQQVMTKRFSIEQILNSISEKRDWVPYPEYSDRTGWNSLLGEHKNFLIKRGERRLNYEWKVIKASDYLEYELSGNRNVMQDPNSANNNALSDLLMAELAEGQGRFITQIINGVFYNCERTSWVLSAHLPVQKSGRSLPEINEVVIDLGSGEMGAMLSWIYYFLHIEFDKINPEFTRRLKSELYNKIITPYRENNHYWWMAFQLPPGGIINNWNPWVNFNVLQTILLIEENKEQKANDIYRSMQSVEKFVDYVNDDGACEEGPSYWGHAAGKLYDYLQLLYLVSNGELSLFNDSKIKSMGEYISRSYIGKDWVVNFADASAKFSADAPLIFRFGQAVCSPEMTQFASVLYQTNGFKPGSGTDIFRLLESLACEKKLAAEKPAHSHPAATIYPGTQFYYFSQKDFFLALKGGYNAESHNHNDAGTFSLWYKNSPALIDVGVGTYTRQTFSAERYKIWTMRSIFHNLPSINGQEQIFGKNYAARNVHLLPDNKGVRMDIAGAYPDQAEVNTWFRTFSLNSKLFELTEVMSLKQAIVPAKFHFMTHKLPVQTANGIVLLAGKEKLLLKFDTTRFKVQIEKITLDDIRLTKVWGDDVYRIILTDVILSTKSEFKFTVEELVN